MSGPHWPQSYHEDVKITLQRETCLSSQLLTSSYHQPATSLESSLPQVFVNYFEPINKDYFYFYLHLVVFLSASIKTQPTKCNV